MEYPIEHMEVKYEILSRDISQLEGKILTLIDATAADPTQRKALKDLIRQNIWEWAYSRLPVGSPNQSSPQNVTIKNKK